MEPVLAEELSPGGSGSWPTIRSQLESCTVVVLVLGDRYGWVPESGPESALGASVTDLEFRYAREHGKVILPFLKRIVDGESPDRRAFRERIESWDSGYFRKHFSTAPELVDGVGKAVIGVLTGAHHREQLRRAAAGTASPVDSGSGIVHALPPALVDVVRDRRAICFVGAGLSLAAGLPSAQAFTDAILDRISSIDPSYISASASGSLFYSSATDLELLAGRAVLQEVAEDLVAPPLGLGPTKGHRIAADRFDLILTTNYDELLEPCVKDRVVLSAEDLDSDLSIPSVVKLAGTIGEPDSLVLTEFALARVAHDRAHVRAAVRAQLATRPLIAIGTSLRDPSVVELLEDIPGRPPGWAVAHEWTRASARRLARWNLTPLEFDAQEFLSSLDASIA